MNKCDICGKKLKKNSYVAFLSLNYCFYDGQCYCSGGKYNEDCLSYDIANVCSDCGDRIKGFIESLKICKRKDVNDADAKKDIDDIIDMINRMYVDVFDDDDRIYNKALYDVIIKLNQKKEAENDS